MVQGIMGDLPIISAIKVWPSEILKKVLFFGLLALTLHPKYKNVYIHKVTKYELY